AFSRVGVSTNTAVATTSGVGTVAMNVTIRKVSDNTTDTAIKWTGVSIPSGFVVASDYVQLDSTITAATGGIEVYTDNTGSDASPKYTGAINATSQTPAGLVNASNTTAKLPTAWTILDAVGTPAAANPATGFNWLYHEDRAQVANNQGAAN